VAPRTFPRYGSAVVTPTAPSTATPPAPEATFARTFVWPALWVFLLPVVGLGFTTFHLEKWAYELREEIRAEQAKAPTIPPEQLEQQLGAIDLGAVAWERCGPLGFNEEPQGLWSGFCGQMLQFTWVQRIGAALLGLATLVFLGLLATIAWADRSPRHQHRAFHLGWTLLRGFSLPHLAGQGLILLFLSFWGTALTMNMYVPKLILMAGILGFLAAAAAVGALWARHHHVPTEHGVVLDPARAPAFFARMRELADRAGTAPPKNVVLGIDDNFFVTEVPLLVAAQLPTPQRPVVETQRLEGRTLYASLSLLRAMDRAEADAVLVHELGHFAQGDTLRSQQMNPLLRRFQAYLSTLAQTFTFGIGSCMVAFYALFERIMKRRSREAELTADRLAAKLIGPSPVAEALLKVGAYMRYRAQTESRILESMTTQELRLAQRVVEGFSRFVAEPSGRSELLSSLLHGGTPHPFDSHPPLEERLRNLGIEAPSSDALTRLAQRPAETACDDILDAEVIEQGLWTAYEERFPSRSRLPHRPSPGAQDPGGDRSGRAPLPARRVPQQSGGGAPRLAGAAAAGRRRDPLRRHRDRPDQRPLRRGEGPGPGAPEWASTTVEAPRLLGEGGSAPRRLRPLLPAPRDQPAARPGAGPRTRGARSASRGAYPSTIGWGYDGSVITPSELERLVMNVPDFPKPGIMFKDLTPIFLNPKAFQGLIEVFAERYRGENLDAVVAIESRGFVIGAPLAAALGVGLVLVRKPGKLPRPTHRRTYALEYGTDTLEMHQDAVRPGARVLIVDDVLATGGTAKAVSDLLGDAQAQIVEAAFVAELGFLSGRKRLAPTPVFAVLEY
jgi:adenine phosphoribosyltransferase